MTQTYRQAILANMLSVIQSISEIKHVEINRAIAVDLDIVPLPCVFIFSDTEAPMPDEGAIGTQAWNFTVTLDVYAQDSDMENLLGLIEVAVMSDPGRGNVHAKRTERLGFELHTISSDRSLMGFSVPYSIVYQHDYGNPYIS